MYRNTRGTTPPAMPVISRIMMVIPQRVTISSRPLLSVACGPLLMIALNPLVLFLTLESSLDVIALVDVQSERIH